MKIAVATNDRKTIAQRTGRAKEFVIHEIIDSVIVNTEYKENSHKHDHEHKDGQEHSHKEIVDLLEGTDLLIVRAIGKHFKRDVEKANIKYKKTKLENIEEIIAIL